MNPERTNPKRLCAARRFSIAVLPAAVMLSGLTCISTGCSATKSAAGPGIDAYVKMRWPARATLAPDESLFFVHNPDGIRQLYKLPKGRDQTQMVRLTHFKDGIGGYSLSDDGRSIAITASIGGSEQSDLFLMDVATAKMQTLFENPEVVYGSTLWRRDSKAFAFRANDESPRDFHVYLYDVASGAKQKVMSGEGYHFPVDFNRDGSKLITGKYNSASYSQLFEVDLSTGELRELTPPGEEWTFEPVGYSADESTFITSSNYRGDLKQLYAIDLRSGTLSLIMPELREHEVESVTFNDDRSILAVILNEDGYRTLHLRKSVDFSPIAGPKIDKGLIGNIDFEGPYMLYGMSNAKTPGLIYRWRVGDSSSGGTAVTSADLDGVDVSEFRLPELIHYPSYDGKEIPAFVYLPNDYRAGRKIPFLVYYHGGPESQFRPGFMRTFQYFLTQGYGVIAPNVRGSSGYGKAYIEADNYKNRHKSVKDGIWAARYLVDQGYTKPKMIGAWGGSYGGFMVMAVITEAPKLVGAACNIVGVVNFKTFLEQTKAYRRHLREVEYGPLSDPEFLESISPIRKIDRVETPLMLAHGLNDPRVPIGEAMQIAVALKKRGQTVEELYFPDEGHGFAKEDNRLLYYRQLALFLDKHLK